MLCLKKRRTYSFTQGVCADLPRRSKKDNRYNESLNMAVTTLPRKHRSREDRSSSMVLTVTEDTPADMLAGSMELLVQLPRDHQANSSGIIRDQQRVTVSRSTPMMDLLVQIATAHKLAASNYTLQAIGERGLVLPHQPNTPIGALDALQVKLLPKQGTIVPRKTRQANQPFETTFRLQVHLPRNQLYVSRVSPKMNLGEILEEVCREKNLDKTRYELRHPANLEETLDLSLSLQDYHLQEVTLYAKQGRFLGSALSSQDIMALQRQEDRRRQQAKQSVFGFIFKKSKESSLSTDSLGGRSVSPARSDETGRSASPLAPAPARPQRKRRPAPKPPVLENEENDGGSEATDKMVISHSRNSSDSSGYHEASVLSDNADSSTRAPETLPRRSRAVGIAESSRKLAQSSQASKSLSNLAAASEGLTHGVSNTSLSSTGLRKKRAAPPPPKARPLSSAISTQGLERIVDSEESLTSDMELSKPPSDIGASSKANSDIDVYSKVSSDIVVDSRNLKSASDIDSKSNFDVRAPSEVGFDKSKIKSDVNLKVKREVEPADVCLMTKSNLEVASPVEDALKVEHVRVEKKVGVPAPHPIPRRTSNLDAFAPAHPKSPNRSVLMPSPARRVHDKSTNYVDRLPNTRQPVNIDKSIDNSMEQISNRNDNEESVQLMNTRNIGLNLESSKSLNSCNNESVENDPLLRMQAVADNSTDSLDRKMKGIPSPDQRNQEVIALPRSIKSISSLENNLTSDNVRTVCPERKLWKSSESMEDVSDKVLRESTSGRIAKESNQLNQPNNGKQCIAFDKRETTQKVPVKPRRKTLELADMTKEIDDLTNGSTVCKVEKLESRNQLALCDKENIFGETNLKQTEFKIRTRSKHKNEMESSLSLSSTFLYEGKNISKHNMKDGNVIKETDSLKKLLDNSEKLSGTSVKYARSLNDIYNICLQDESNVNSNTSNSHQKRRSCTIISTIPKCDHLRRRKEDLNIDKIIQNIVEIDDQKMKASESIKERYDVTKNSGSNLDFSFEESIVDCNLNPKDQITLKVRSKDELDDLENSKRFDRARRISKWPKVFRSLSENNFEINTFERHSRHHLTSHLEDFTCALNPNLSTEMSDWSSDIYDSDKKTSSDCDLGSIKKDLSKVVSDTNLTIEAKFPAFMSDDTNLRRWKSLEDLEDDSKPDPWIIGESGGEDVLSDTDILLQKVSDTLSDSLQLSSHSPSLPASRTPSSIIVADVQSNKIARDTTKSILNKTREVLSETPESIKKIEESAVRTDRSKDEQNQISSDATDLGRSAPMAINCRQDITLDCALVNGDDLSIVDWEYQLPAPPSAFRDTDSPAFDGYDTITLQSVEVLKEPVACNVDFHDANIFVSSDNVDLPLKESSNEKILRETDSNSKQKTKLEAEPEVAVTPLMTKEKRLYSKQTSSENHKSEVNLELKKEIISELENRLENGRLSQSSSKASKSDSRRILVNSSTPEVAPVDNTLSNFTITTYSSQRSLNIFDEVEYQQQGVPINKKSNDRIIKNFATLTRNSATLKSSSTDSTDARKNCNILSLDLTPMEMSKFSAQHNLSDDIEFRKPVPKTFKQHELVSRHQSFNSDNVKSNDVHRSNSYISPINNLRYKDMNGENEQVKLVALQFENDECGVKKSISSNNVSQEVLLRSNEKFSQWRDNILKRQEEPSKEKQLQSLQVLKSILPQLKNNQQAEENVSKQCNGTLSDKKKLKILSHERTIESKAASTMTESQARTEMVPLKLKSEESNKKCHSYAGPPAINLGSWSERPCINVQIKMDTDYKFGENNASGAKTVVNLNGLRDETDIVQYNNDVANTLPKRVVKNDLIENDAKPEAKQSEKKEPREFSKKVITHSSGFKRPALNKVGFPETKLGSRNEEKPVVAGAELKKISTDGHESLKERDEEIDTKPVNFKELTKTFGQEVCFRAKPKHIIQNRHSDYCGTKPDVIQHFTKSDINQNGCTDLNKASKPTEFTFNNHVASNGVQNGMQNVPVKKYTSVVGIHSQNPHFGIQNGNYLKNNSSSIKITGPMPVVKGFKIQASQIEPKVVGIPAKQNDISMADCSKKSTQTPKPPTMPVITGVTLKSANAKPKSVYLDSRDQLLESIRSFGGRDKLRCVAGRY